MNAPRVAYVGMTHLGLCSAVAAASRGFMTLGFDPDAALIGQLDAGRLPVVEPGLDDLLAASRSRLTFSSDTAYLSGCEVIYVSPDVPTDDSGRSDLSSIDRLLDVALSAAAPHALVVVLSQVPPGFVRSRQRDGVVLLYQVETLVFGRGVERAVSPERIIVGCDDPSVPLPDALRTFLDAFECPILPMRFESAELAKISINCCLVASVSMANTLAEICERVGADWSEIAPALKLDRRIGLHAYLTPGLGLGGGNLERDLATVDELSRANGTEAGVIRSFVANSSHRKNWAIRVLHERLLADATDVRIGILGLAYKENTASIKNSPSIALLRLLAPWPVQVYDPAVAAAVALPARVRRADTALEAARGADALAIMTPWAEFRAIKVSALRSTMRGRLVLDPFRVLDRRAALAEGLDHRTLGVS